MIDYYHYGHLIVMSRRLQHLFIKLDLITKKEALGLDNGIAVLAYRNINRPPTFSDV